MIRDPTMSGFAGNLGISKSHFIGRETEVYPGLPLSGYLQLSGFFFLTYPVATGRPVFLFLFYLLLF